ncbi:MAG: hypothetical protein M1541_17740 [Acidobacteria bacterium]|nr:hypothetical protein [Acidobacteriota bacterium]
MNPSTATLNRFLAFTLAGVALLTFSASSAGAQVMLRVPDQSPGMPAYAWAARPFVWHTEQWAAIVFLRAPGCVPTDFNRLELYDLPAPPGHPGAFACPLAVSSGFELRDTPDINVWPRQAVNHGIAVPVWFVTWPVFQAAIADDVLTKSELESLAPLKGVATTYHEVLHPISTAHLTIVASGFLSDGRSFQYEFNAPSIDHISHVRIVIR